MDFSETVLTRRSIREFTEEVISEQNVTDLIRAGMSAPSAHDQRPWIMLSITNREKLEQLTPLTPWWKMLHKAPLAIITCADTRLLGNINPEFQVASCVAATENMLLMAHGLGLGAVWLGICEGEENYQKFKDILNIPDYARVISMIAVGHIAKKGEAPLEDRFDNSKWYRENWA